MSHHKVYGLIVSAIKQGKLTEPFDRKDFRRACLGLGEGTYRAFLDKHRLGNPGENSELFIKVSPGKFKMIRPYKYGL